MISGSTVNATQKLDVESATWLLEKLAVDGGYSIDRFNIRRAVDEAAAVWNSGSDDNWWKWIVDASRSLGFKCKVIDATFQQAIEILEDEGKFIAREGAEERWFAATISRRRKIQVQEPFADREQRNVSKRQLMKLLNLNSKDEVIRCVVFESQLTGTIEPPANEQGRSPIGRLLSLLSPERTDIFVILIFALVTGILALATPMAVETLVNTVAFGKVVQPVVFLAIMLLAFLTFSAALRVLQNIVVELIQRRLFARIAADLSYRLPRVELEAFEGQSARELTNRFFEIATVQKICAQLLLDGIALVLGTLIGMAVLAFYHPWLLGFDVVLIAMIVFIILVLGRGAIQTSIKESKTKYQMAAWLENLSSCPIAFRHGGAAEFALERSDRYIHDYLTARKAHFRILMRQVIFALGLQAVASTVLLGLGGWLVMSGQLTLGQLVAAELIVTVIVGSFAKLGKHVESFYDLLASVDKLGVLFDLPVEVQNGVLNIPNSQAAKVQLHNLSYSGLHGKTNVNGLQFTMSPGERVVVWGSSGSGKSQLLDLLFGTKTASAGYVTINDIDPRDLRPDALRRYVTLVRDIEVLDGSIAENIHLERPYVSTQDVRDALLKVGMLETVLALPNGLDTQLVETGYPLSKSQVQKLMFARALAGAPRLLLVDGLLDAFSDDDFHFMTEVLFAADTPWTLVIVSGREELIDLGSSSLCMNSGRSVNLRGDRNV